MNTGEELFVHKNDLTLQTTVPDVYLVVGEYVEFEKVCVNESSMNHKAIHVRGVCDGPLMCETNTGYVQNFTRLT